MQIETNMLLQLLQAIEAQNIGELRSLNIIVILMNCVLLLAYSLIIEL